MLPTVQLPEASESDGVSETTEKSDDGSPDMEDTTYKTQCNTSLPLPSTEEGSTMLVTTKTVQTYNCRTRYTEDVTLGIWRTEIVQEVPEQHAVSKMQYNCKLHRKIHNVYIVYSVFLALQLCQMLLLELLFISSSDSFRFASVCRCF